MKTIQKLLIVCAVAMLLSQEADAKRQPVSAEVLNGAWAIEKVNGRSLISMDEDMPYVIFSTEHSFLFASDGHNTVNASYNFNAGKSVNDVRFSKVVASRQNADASTTKALVSALNNTNSYTYEDSDFPTLHFYKGDTELLTLRKLGLSNLDGAWRVVSIRDMNVPSGDEIQLVIDTTDGRVYGNTGFNIFRGTIWIDTTKPRAIQFQAINASDNEPENAKLETRLIVALEEVESVKSAKGDKVVLLDGNERPVLTLQRIRLSRQN